MHSATHRGTYAQYLQIDVQSVCTQYSVHATRVEWNLSKTATFGPVLTGLYREVAALQRQIAML